MSYDEAAAILKRKGIEFTYGDDFGAPQEVAVARNSTAPSWSTASPPTSKPSI